MTWLVCIAPSVFQVLLQLEAPVTTRNRLVSNQEQAGDSWIDSWQSGKTVTVSQSGLAPLTGSSSQAPKSHTERYPQGLPRGREDERPNDDLMTNRTTTRTTFICWCGRTFNTVHGMRIHQTKKACWSIQRSPDSDAKDSCGGNPIPGEPCKAEGTVSEDNPPIADGHAEDPSLEESVARIMWPATSDKAAWKQLDEDLSKVLAGAFKAGSLRCLASFGKIVYQYCKERFGVLEQREPQPRTNKESRRQAEIREVRAQLRQLKKAWKAASQQRKPEIDILRNQTRERLFTLRRAEASRKGRKERERKRKAFFENPHRFTKKLFEAARSGRLTVSQGELETHLKRLYSDPQREEEMEPIPGLKRPTHPGIQFDTAEPRLKEVTAFLKKSRAGSTPGPNGVSYKVYKACDQVRQLLWKVLRLAWRREIIPQEWSTADGIYIPKEEESKLLGQFRPISLLNVERKVFFGVLAKRMVDFLVANGLVDTSVQKAGVPGFPGCVEHCSMIWNTIQEAKAKKRDLSVVWLDLANAYGSVPHRLIKFSMDFFHIPTKIQRMLMSYYDNFKMRFTTSDYTTDWVDLQVGIPMGCTVSPVLFVLAMQVIVRSSEDSGQGVEVAPGQILPPIRSFMDDLTRLNSQPQISAAILQRLQVLIEWTRMAFKAKKSRSLVLKRGRVQKYTFHLRGEVIPAVSESPVKSLGRWYTKELKDTNRAKEIIAQMNEGLASIERSGLPGKCKLWCLQFGLLPRLIWPLTIYEVAITHVEAMERKISGMCRKWLGVPLSLTAAALYGHSSKLVLPMTSITEEFKVTKAKLHLTLHYSADPVISNVAPEVKSGRKWQAAGAVEEAISSLQHKEIVGATQAGRQGLGSQEQVWWSRAQGKSRRELVAVELSSFEEHKRLTKAVGQSKQGAWTRWEGVEQKKLTWSDLWSMEQHGISFLLRSVYMTSSLPLQISLNGSSPTQAGVACVRGMVHCSTFSAPAPELWDRECTLGGTTRFFLS